MMKDEFKLYHVIIEGGSGCFFQPKSTLEHTYILTARHIFEEFTPGESVRITRLIYDGKFYVEKEIEFSFLPGQNYFPHETADACILRVDHQPGFEKIFQETISTLTRADFRLYGYPEKFRENEEGARDTAYPIEMFTVPGNDIFGAQLSTFTLTQPNLRGMSGGAILSPRENCIAIAGIQSRMAVLSDVPAGQINFTPIEVFNEIVAYPAYSGKLVKLDSLYFDYSDSKNSIIRLSVKSTAAVEPRELMGPFRAAKLEEYYMTRACDHVLHECVNAGKHCVIVGLAEAGKSRMLYRLLTTYYRDSITVLIGNREKNGDMPSIDATLQAIGKISQRHERVFFVMDDLQEFLESKHLNDIVDEIKSYPNNILLATCTLSDFEAIKTMAPELCHDGPDSPVELTIPVLSEAEQAELHARFESRESNYPVVGSYVLGFDSLIKVYRTLGRKSLEREILWAIKCTNLICRKHRWTEEAIRDYAENRWRHYHKKDGGIKPSDWEIALDKLERAGFTRTTSDLIFVDNTFLKKITRPPVDGPSLEGDPDYVAERVICADAVKNYAPRDIGKRKPVLYRLFLRATHNANREWVYEKIKEEGISIEPIILDYRIRNSASLEEAKAYYKTYIDSGLIPTSYTAGALIKWAPDCTAARLKLEEMERDGLVPDEYVFRFLLSRATEFSEAWDCYDYVKCSRGSGQSPLVTDLFFYGMLRHARSFNQGLELLREMRDLGIKPNQQFYQSMIIKPGGDYEEAWKEYTELKTMMNPAEIDPVVIARIIEKAQNLNQAREAFSEIDKISFVKKIRAHVFNCFLKKFENFDEAKEIFDGMGKYGTKPTTETHNLLMSVAQSLDKRLEWVKRMKHAGAKVDVYSFYLLIQACGDFNSVEKYYKQYKRECLVTAGNKPHLSIYNLIIERMSMIRKKEAVHKKAYYYLTEIMDTSKTCDAQKFLNKVGLLRMLSQLMRKLGSVEHKLEYLRWCYQHEVKAERYLSFIAENCHDRDSFTLLLQTIETIGETPSYDTCYSLVTHKETAGDVDFLLEVIDALHAKMGVEAAVISKLIDGLYTKIDESGFSRLVDKVRSMQHVVLSRGVRERLLWLELESAKESGIQEGMDRFERKYGFRVDIPHEYLEWRIKGCHNFETARQLYQAILERPSAAPPAPSLLTFRLLLQTVSNLPSHHIIDAIQWILGEAAKRNAPVLADMSVYVTKLIKKLIKQRLVGTTLMLTVYEMILDYNIPLKGDAVEEMYWSFLFMNDFSVETVDVMMKERSLSWNIHWDSLIRRCIEFGVARKVLEGLVALNIRPRTSVLCRLLELATSPEEVDQAFEKIQQHDIVSDYYLLVHIIRFSGDFDRAEWYYERFISGDTAIDDAQADFLRYKMMIGARSFAMASKYFWQAMDRNAQYRVILYRQLSDLVASHDEAVALLEISPEFDYKISDHAWDILILSSGNEALAEFVTGYAAFGDSKYYELFKALKGTVPRSFPAAIKKHIPKLDGLNDVERLVKLMDAFGIPLTEDITVLISKACLHSDDAIWFFDRIRSGPYPVQRACFRTLLAKILDPHKIDEVLDNMQSNGFELSVKDYAVAPRAVLSFSEEKAHVLAQQPGSDFTPGNENTYSELLYVLAPKSENLADALWVFDELIRVGAELREIVFTSIFRFAQPEDALVYFRKMAVLYGRKIDKGILNSVAKKINDFNQSWQFIGLLQEFNLDFEIPFARLKWQCGGNYDNMKRLIDNLTARGKTLQRQHYLAIIECCRTMDDAVFHLKNVPPKRQLLDEKIFDLALALPFSDYPVYVELCRLRKSSGFSLGAVSYKIILGSGCSFAEAYPCIESLIKEMPDGGRKKRFLNKDDCNLLLSKAVTPGDFKNMMQVFLYMKKNILKALPKVCENVLHCADTPENFNQVLDLFDNNGLRMDASASVLLLKIADRHGIAYSKAQLHVSRDRASRILRDYEAVRHLFED